MELTPFSFLNQEIHDDLSLFSNFLFPDMADYPPAAGDDSSFGVGGSANHPSKRRRKEEEEDGGQEGEPASRGGDGWPVGDIAPSLVLLEEVEKRKREDSFFLETLRGKASLESDSDMELPAMGDYYRHLQPHYDGANELKMGKNKRARQSGSAGAAAAEGGDPHEATSATPSVGQQRRLWVKDRSKDWWERCNSPEFPDEEFRREFRMSKATFDFICGELDAAVTKKNTMLRDAIPVRQRVAVCVWRLATGEPLRFVSKRFGLGISTCHKLVLEVCSAIRDVLMPKFLQWPDEPQLGRIKRRFESLSGIPNVAGSMYTTHVPIIAPKNRVAEYYNKRHTERNQRTSYSITVQGVVDDRGAFTDICIGWPGSLPDDRVLEKSALHQRASRGLLRDVWIVGNSGHPLTDWVLAPYTQKNQTWAQHGFNERVGAVQRVAREAFARLKGRWACLQKRTEVKLQDLPVVLGACCILHNICEMREEPAAEAGRFELFDDEMVAENAVRSAAAQQARDHIAHNLLHHGPARP